jgi:FKBP-type peptidyl-prolyl cis-trans isomerase
MVHIEEEDDDDDDLSHLQGLQLDADGSVVKSFRRRGSGKLRPARGERVTCHVVGRLEDGSEFASTRGGDDALQFVIGDTTVEGRLDLTDIPSGLNEGLVTMARGEVASFKLAASKAHGEAGLSTGAVPVPPDAAVEYEVELLSWAEDLQKDGGLLLTRAAAEAAATSVGGSCPTDLTTVRMRYSAATADGAVVEDCSGGDGVEFMIDDGSVMLGLELAAKRLHTGEKARLEIQTVGKGGAELPYGYASMGPDHPHASVTGSLVIELELLPFTPCPTKAVEELSGAERLVEVERVRELGVGKFKAGQYSRARRRFERAMTVASHRNVLAAAMGAAAGGSSESGAAGANGSGGGAGGSTAAETARLLEHRAALSNNIAACCLKLEEWDSVLQATNTTLQLKPSDAKALYRQGIAHNRLASYDRAKAALRKALKIEAAKEKPDRALMRLIKAEYNGVTSEGLEKNKAKEKDVWGGKLQSTEPPPPTGLMAKAAAAVSSAVGVKPKGGESPLSPKKKKKKKKPKKQQAAAAAVSPSPAAEDGAADGGGGQQQQQKKPSAVKKGGGGQGVWWSLLQKCAPAAGVLLVLLFMALRRRR